MVNWGKIIFGGVDSSEYGIYITGEAVYNAPERDVEFVEIPGRNGALALDKGRFKNITVTYPAGAFGKSQEEFREALSEFRNAIMSQTGYQKLKDSYHPEEYRLAVYAAGLEVEPASYGRVGEFDLVFECKPQRWLKVGAYPIPTDSGDILENPTLFDASPLLEVTGHGDINFNDFTISLDDVPIGETPILTPDGTGMDGGDASKTYDIDGALFNVGDTITVKPSVFRFDFAYTGISSGISVSKTAGDVTPTVESSHRGGVFSVVLSFPTLTYTAPSAGAFVAKSYMGTVTMSFSTGTAVTATIIAQVIGYGKDGDDPPNISFIASATVDTTDTRYLTYGAEITETGATVDSSISVLGNPTYIDCEIGEAYKIVDDESVSVNKGLTLGSDLPTLSAGTNAVNFDNTITDLKITPRWWRI